MLTLVHFKLDETRYAVPAARVIEIVPRVLLTPLPGVPPPVLGVFSYRGVPVSAVDLRARLMHAPRAPGCEDHFIIAEGARRLVALVVERVDGIQRVAREDVLASPSPSPHIAGVVRLEDGLLLIDDLDAVLSLAEERAIDAGLLRLETPA